MLLRIRKAAGDKLLKFAGLTVNVTYRVSLLHNETTLLRALLDKFQRGVHSVSNLILIEPSCFHLLKYMSLLTRPDPVNEAVDDFLKKAGAYRRRGSHLQNLRAVGF
jgi:hypothetical protein